MVNKEIILWNRKWNIDVFWLIFYIITINIIFSLKKFFTSKAYNMTVKNTKAAEKTKKQRKGIIVPQDAFIITPKIKRQIIDIIDEG